MIPVSIPATNGKNHVGSMRFMSLALHRVTKLLQPLPVLTR